MFWKHCIYITKKTPKLVAKILATKMVLYQPDCWVLLDWGYILTWFADINHGFYKGVLLVLLIFYQLVSEDPLGFTVAVMV